MIHEALRDKMDSNEGEGGVGRGGVGMYCPLSSPEPSEKLDRHVLFSTVHHCNIDERFFLLQNGRDTRSRYIRRITIGRFEETEAWASRVQHTVTIQTTSLKRMKITHWGEKQSRVK